MVPLGRNILQFQLEVGKNPGERIVDFVRGTKRELRQRSVFLVFRELSLKLALFLAELAFLGEPQEELLQSGITFLFPLP